MFGKIKNYFAKRRNERETKNLRALLDSFDSLAKLEKAGMITFDVKNRRLFVEQPLADLMLASTLTWKNFMQNTFLWLYWRQCQEAWDKFILKEEMTAVHRAQRKYAALTHADIMRIRQARRDEISQSDMEPIKVEPFEFFVIRTVVEGADDKEKHAKPSAEILAVGNYDYEQDTFDMASWEDVKLFMEGKEDTQKGKKKK